MLRKILFKYKLLHVILWTLVSMTTFFVYHNKTQPIFPQAANVLMVNLIATFPFYITAYVLVPRYLYEKRYWKFSIILICLVAAFGFIMMFAVRSVDKLFDPTVVIIPADKAKLRFTLNLFTWSAMIAAFGGGGLKIMSDSFRIKNRLREVENEKIITELSFLRSQINPHFLFNVINLIYFQIDKKNAEARASVEKLSEMLRYQLYECTTDKIEIEKEINYLQNYVAIQRLRLEKDTNIYMQIDENVRDFKIAPLLILPLVENAFKHISNKPDPKKNKITIRIKNESNRLVVIQVENTFETEVSKQGVYNGGGLGIQNLTRRLNLLYPEKHELTVEKNADIYYTKLIIQYAD